MIDERRFRVKKNGEPWKQCVCRTPELIENYEKAVNDTTQTWICHHRLESCFSQKFLIQMGLYYDVEPEALIFLTIAEHNMLESRCKRMSITKKGHKRPDLAERNRQNKGKPLSEEHKRKISESCYFKAYKGKTWKVIDGKRVWLDKENI